MSEKKWLEKFISNIICMILSHKFCTVPLRVHYTLLINIFYIKLIVIVNWTFHDWIFEDQLLYPYSCLIVISSCSKTVLISIIILSLIASFSFFSLKKTLMFFILWPSDCFYISNFFDHFLLPYTVCLPFSWGVFGLKDLQPYV